MDASSTTNLRIPAQFGSNPAGVTANYETRVELLKLAKKHDFIIIEDDPYYFIYYGDTPRAPSYFALEGRILGEVGRVLRLDSFSKIMSSGLRLGWVTGPTYLVDALDRHVCRLTLVKSGQRN